MRARLASLAAVAAVVPACAFGTAGSAALGATPSGPVSVTDTETVQVYADPTGAITSQRVYEQLTLDGHGHAQVANPVSTDDLRNLDGFGGLSVSDGRQVVNTAVDGQKQYRMVSTNTAKLPLTFTASYTLDGKAVTPSQIVGRSGHLVVTYHVANVTGVPTKVTVKNGRGATVTRTVDVPIPMVATLSTTAPESFRNVTSSDANMGGDGHGGTMLSFTMTLIPPIGRPSATVSYAADITDGIVPRAELEGLPVDPLTNPSFKGGASSYKAGAASGVELTSGALELDSNLLKLRSGASDLLSGLIKLHTGAGQLSGGLGSSAAPGANKLATGTDQLAGGGKQLASGAGQLSAGLAELQSQVPKLRAGVSQLATGQSQLADGLTQLYDGVQGLPRSVDEQLKSNLSYQGLLTAAGQVGASLDRINDDMTAIKAADLTGADPAQSTAVTAAAQNAAVQVANAESFAQIVTSGIPTLVDSLTAQIRDQLSAGLGTPAKGCNPKKTLRCAAAALAAGGAKLNQAAPQLASGVDRLATGGKQLASGANKLSAGIGQVDGGAHQLASGLGTAASGAGQIDGGLGKATKGAPQIVSGAHQLSQKGSKKLAAAGAKTSVDYGVMYAELEAGARRVHRDGMAYGAPAGAQGLTAYDYILVGDDGQDRRELHRGLLGGGALLLGGGVWLLRRRFSGRSALA